MIIFLKKITGLWMFLVFTLLIQAQENLSAQSHQISNGVIQVIFSGNRLSVQTLGTQSPFISSISLRPGRGIPVQKITETHPVWGVGECLRIVEQNGNVQKIILYPDLPFVMMQRTLINATGREFKLSKDTMLVAAVSLSRPAELLRINSIGGLYPATRETGGYVYMAVGDPVTYEGLVCGWLTHERGSGIVLNGYRENQQYLTARIDYGDLRIAAGASAETETLVIGYGRDVRILLEQYGELLSRQLAVNLPPMPNVYCTWYHARASDEKKIAVNADFAATHLKPYGLNVMQIDDYWQLGVKENGPRRNFTDVRPDGPYPGGMKATADYLHQKGFSAGIWYIPFAGSWNDPWWKDKTHLFLKEGASSDNHIYNMEGVTREMFKPGEAPYEVRWGGTCLDLTHPESREYVRFIANRLSNEWGYNYFKVDGLFTGTGARIQYINSEYKDDDLGLQTRYNPAITPVEAYAGGLELIKEGAGDELFLLGCCLPQNMRSFGPAMGRVDAMRVGPDNGASPRLLIRGPQFSSRVYFLNKRVWYNDPDPAYVRTSMPEEMAKTSVSWVSLTGSMHSSSEQYDELPADRLRILQKSLPSHNLKTVRPVDFLENDPPEVWHLYDDREAVRKDVIGLFNWDVSQNASVAYSLDRIGLPEAARYVGYDFWGDRFIPPFSDSISALLSPGGCRIISVRPVKDHPQVVGTSRHLTQGVTDLSGERWNSETQTLSGTSAVIAGDVYEIRMVVPEGEHSWRVRNVTAGSAHSAAVTSYVQEGSCIRVTISPEVTGTVDWKVTFDRESVKNKAYPFTDIHAEVAYENIVLQLENGPPFQYDLFRNDVWLGQISSDSYTDTDIELGKTYTYRVEPVFWHREKIKISEYTVKMPESIKRPDIPGLPEVPCARLKPVRTSGSLMPGMAASHEVTPEGVVSGSRIGAQGASTLVYDIPSGAKRLVATVIADTAGMMESQARVGFSVHGDVMEMGEPVVEIGKSPAVRLSQNHVWHFDIDLDNRLKQVWLQVDVAGGEGEKINVDWINAGFVF